LIVMTSHGRTGLSRAWLGSVADGLIRHSRLPVLVLRPIESKTARTAAHHLFKHILVPLDGSAGSDEVIPTAAALARCGGGHLTLLRVVQPLPLVSAESSIPFGYAAVLLDDPATLGLVELAKQELAETAKRAREGNGLIVDADVVVDAPVARGVIDFSEKHTVDCIAMSMYG